MTTQFFLGCEVFKKSILAEISRVESVDYGGNAIFSGSTKLLWYPPNYLLLLMPLELGFFILLIGHFILAAVFACKVSDTLQSNRLVGWLGATMFVFSPKLIGHIEEGNWSLVIAACWLPFFYWALTHKRFNWVAIAISAIVINNLNIGYYAILFVAAFLIFLKRSNLTAARLDLKILKIFIITVILTIPRWLPLALFR